MKTSEFKKILKPLIRQAVKEVILEEGMLSNIVAEVVRGVGSDIVLEARAPTKSKTDLEAEEKYEKQRQERIRRLNESTRLPEGVFENTAPMQESQHGPLAGQSSDDAGVDISGILGLANNKWEKLI
jgi:hypothetical protein